METGIPVATDNIFKFYALFGLLLIISSGLGFVYVHTSSNAASYQTFLDLESLKSKTVKSPDDEKRIQALAERRVVDKQDRDTYLYVLGGAIGFGISLSVLGFGKWHKQIQPQQDRMIELQLIKLEQEVRLLQRQ